MDLGALERTPEAGDPEEIDGLVAGYVSRADRFTQRAVSVRASADALVAGSAGAWALALNARSAQLASGLDDAAGGCRQVAQVLAGYASALRAMERRVTVARHEVSTARIRAVRARASYEAAVIAGGGVPVAGWSWADVPPFAAVGTAAGELRAWRAAVNDAAAGVRAFEACCTEWEELDRAAVSALVAVDVMTSYAPGTGIDAIVDVPVVQALAAARTGTMTGAQREALVGWLTDAVMRVADAPGDAPAVRVLSEFLDAWGGDEEVMGDVFATLGGAGSIRMFTALGNAVRSGDQDRNVTLAAVATRLRDALSSGSAAWTQTQADGFADEMFGPVLFEDGTASVIGYLFADPDSAPMGVTLTVAVADRIDAWEQEYQGRLPVGVPQPGYWLAAVGGSDPRGVLDPAAGVLATLGVYPGAAQDWLTGTGVDWSVDSPVFDRSRIDYWFGARDWSQAASDGLAGVGRLWVGVQATGGSLLAAQRVAAINDAVFAELSSNPSLILTENVSDEGALRLAQVVEAQLPGLIEVGAMRGPVHARVAWELVASPVATAGVTAAAVTRSELVPVLAAATSRPSGYNRVQDAFLDYEAAALTGATEGRASPSMALDRLAVVWGVADGAIDGAAHAEFQRASDAVRDSVGVARAPVDVALTLVRHPIVAIGVDAAVGHLEEVAVRHLTPDAPGVAHIRIAGAEPVQDFFAGASQAYRDAGAWDGPPPGGGAATLSPAEVDGATLYQRYRDVSDAMRLALTTPADNTLAGGGG